ncbi:MAG: hypothetical protein IPJ01_12815 [Micavibrio sp.]|nr:hypothetical protein [Micavibrio sp.]
MRRVDAFTESAGIDESEYLKFIGRHELWRYARESLTRFQGIRPNQFTLSGETVEWQTDPDDEIPLGSFSSDSVEPIYKAGFFYGGGQIHTRVKVHKPVFRLRIRARSSAARGVFPYLVVRLDGRVMNAHYIDMRVNADYYSLIETEPGSRLLALEFVNDAGDGKTGQDRNIWIEKVEIQYPKES